MSCSDMGCCVVVWLWLCSGLKSSIVLSQHEDSALDYMNSSSHHHTTTLHCTAHRMN